MANGNYVRKISKKRFFLALVLTSIIFLLGLLVGHTLTLDRTSYLADISYRQKLDYESLQLQSLFLDLSASNQSCSLFNKILETSLTNVADAQAKVDFYLLESTMGSDTYKDLKRDYSLAQIRYWLLNKKIKETCEPDHVSILYFYSNEECVDCGPQGTILIYLKEKLKDKLLVFSLDADFIDEPMINLLKQTYNITRVPSIVIEDRLFNELLSKDELIKEICNIYNIKPEIC